MTVLVALLRGINVGGATTLPMSDLRRVATDLGYADVATYIQSGNLLLRTPCAPATVGRDLAEAIAALGGVAPTVIVRTSAELAEVVAGNPFLERGEDPARCHVLFTEGPASRAVSGLDPETYHPEEAVAGGSVLYLFLPNGVGRSPLATELTKAKVGTIRSWRTLTKLVELTQAR